MFSQQQCRRILVISAWFFLQVILLSCNPAEKAKTFVAEDIIEKFKDADIGCGYKILDLTINADNVDPALSRMETIITGTMKVGTPDNFVERKFEMEWNMLDGKVELKSIGEELSSSLERRFLKQLNGRFWGFGHGGDAAAIFRLDEDGVLKVITDDERKTGTYTIEEIREINSQTEITFGTKKSLSCSEFEKIINTDNATFSVKMRLNWRNDGNDKLAKGTFTTSDGGLYFEGQFFDLTQGDESDEGEVYFAYED